MTISKEKIIEEIRRTALENDGKPLGIGRFEKETGIKQYEWQRYWPQFSKAQEEAGLSPNKLQAAYGDEFLFKSIISLTRRLNKFPTTREIRIEKINNPEFPDNTAFNRAFGHKQDFVLKVLEYCNNKKDYSDIVNLCNEIHQVDTAQGSSLVNKETLGIVYLFRHGKYYKIGKSNDTVRRGNEIKIQLPEKLDLIHEIKTDDPSGIEAYWHKRFDSKRMNGEWFDLNSSEIKAFKRWKKIF